MLAGKIALKTRELIQKVCQINDVEILSGHVEKDHIHLQVLAPSHISVSKLVQYGKVSSLGKLQII